jgi:hypothetical protein
MRKKNSLKPKKETHFSLDNQTSNFKLETSNLRRRRRRRGGGGDAKIQKNQKTKLGARNQQNKI